MNLLRHVYIFLLCAPFMGVSACSNKCTDQSLPYWAFTTGKQWVYEPEGELHNSLEVLLELKEVYGEEFQIVIRDPESKCILGLDEPKPEKVQLYVVVDPANPGIARRLDSIGMTYQE